MQNSHISHSVLYQVVREIATWIYFTLKWMRRGLNLTRGGSLFRFVLSDGFIQTARANDLPSRETLRQLVTKRPSSSFAGFNRLDCFANVKSSEAVKQTSRFAEALLNDVIIMIIIIISLCKMSARHQSLTLMQHRAELTSAWSSRDLIL